LKLIIARAAAGDAIWFKATIDRIADILTRHGNDDPVDFRRSKAIGILAQPAEALRLLCQHQDDDWDGFAEPDDLAAEPVELADDQPDSTKPADQTSDTDPADFEPSSDPASSQEARHRSLTAAAALPG
jgi:hypothetical protein